MFWLFSNVWTNATKSKSLNQNFLRIIIDRSGKVFLRDGSKIPVVLLGNKVHLVFRLFFVIRTPHHQRPNPVQQYFYSIPLCAGVIPCIAVCCCIHLHCFRPQYDLLETQAPAIPEADIERFATENGFAKWCGAFFYVIPFSYMAIFCLIFSHRHITFGIVLRIFASVHPFPFARTALPLLQVLYVCRDQP